MSDHSTHNLPWRPHWVGDHARIVKGWPAAARTALIELLDHQWASGSLPDDLERLRAIAGLTNREWAVAWHFVEAEFPIGADGLRRNLKLSEQHTERMNERAWRSRTGVLGAEARWRKQP